MRFFYLSLPLLLSCGEAEKKTAIFISVQTDEDVNIRDYADTLWIYVDPESGSFVDANGEPYEAGLNQNGSTYKTYFGNYVTDDDELEMGLKLDLGDWSGETLPIVEFAPSSRNPGPFQFSASAFSEGSLSHWGIP